MIDAQAVRQDFAILDREVNGKPLTYLDSAATSLKPRQVIEAVDAYYQNHTANIHRGIHTLSEEATEAYEAARKKIASFINASPREIIFVRNATEGINLLAHSFAHQFSRKDRILLTEMEHHSNIVPWQILSKQAGTALDFVSVHTSGNWNGLLDWTDFEKKLSAGPKIMSLTHVSNVLGTINPIEHIVKKAHSVGALAIVDAAQSVPHMPVDVKQIGADFTVFSGHKMCGPSGIGVLYGRRDLLEEMEPWMGGGDMIKEVRFDGFVPNELPWKFEAGTPNIEGAIGLGAAVDYLQSIGLQNIRRHEKQLVDYALEKLQKIPSLAIYGNYSTDIRGGVIAFNLADIHAHDLTQVLDGEGIATRSGHHCAQPLIHKLGLAAAARASFYLYNTPADIDVLVAALEKAKKVFNV
jgi:cysteine desulfurase/selenocysteine lyase